MAESFLEDGNRFLSPALIPRRPPECEIRLKGIREKFDGASGLRLRPRVLAHMGKHPGGILVRVERGGIKLQRVLNLRDRVRTPANKAEERRIEQAGVRIAWAQFNGAPNLPHGTVKIPIEQQVHPGEQRGLADFDLNRRAAGRT